MVWALILVVGVATRSAFAAPQNIVAELRAATCCAEHCPMAPRHPSTPRRCCFVDSAAGDPVSTQLATTLERPGALAIAFVPPVARALTRAVLPARAEVMLVRAGPPVYLRNLTLQR
jgi:hypothetical protein